MRIRGISCKKNLLTKVFHSKGVTIDLNFFGFLIGYQRLYKGIG